LNFVIVKLISASYKNLVRH